MSGKELQYVTLCYERSKLTLELFEAHPILREMAANAEARNESALDMIIETGYPSWSVVLKWQDREEFLFLVRSHDSIEIDNWSCENGTDSIYEGPFDLQVILQVMGISAHDVAAFEASKGGKAA